jgi:tetratricopeptide (TPR) repeat protein
LTHIDADGNSTPPVVLDHLTAPDRAANIPEFVALPPAAIRRIREEFVNDHSFVRAGNECVRNDRTDEAVRNFEEALRLNPANVDAHQKLGFLFCQVKGVREAGLAHSMKALEIEPRHPYACEDMAMFWMQRGEHARAESFFEKALASLPEGADKPYDAVTLRRSFAVTLFSLGKYDRGAELLIDAAQRAPDDAAVIYYLAVARAYQGGIEEPERLYRRALELDPRVDIAPAFHDRMGINYAAAGRFPEALAAARRALELARMGGLAELAARIEERIALYERGAPYAAAEK